MTETFWILVGLLFYSYVGYGLLVILLARLRGRPERFEEVAPLSATLLISAHNEFQNITGKLQNALSLETGPHDLGILVVSDGSTDGTAAAAARFADQGVQTIEIKEHVGKIAALNRAMVRITSDVVIFSDANSMIAKDAIVRMLRNFSAPGVGGVCGSIGVPRRKRGWLGQGEALYWRYDHALKVSESALSGAVSAQGSLYAIRRELLSPLPPAVADDLLNSLRVVAQGKRLVFEPEATVVEVVSESARSEFRRRARSTERGWRGLMLMSELLNPFKYGFYSVQLFSHKVLRRINPFLLVALAAVNLLTLSDGAVYVLSGGLQAAFYGLAFIGWLAGGRATTLASVPFFFVLGHAAMALGLINVARGKKSDRWSPARDAMLGK